MNRPFETDSLCSPTPITSIGMSVKLHFCNNFLYLFFRCSWTIMWKHRLQHCKASLFSMSLPVKSTRSRCDCTEDSYRNSCQTLYLFKHIQHISELLNKAVHSKSFWSYCFPMMNARFYSPLYPILHSIFILSLWFYSVCCS